MSNRPYSPDDEPIIGYAEDADESVSFENDVIGFDDGGRVPSGRNHRTAVIEPYYDDDDLDPYYDEYAQDSPARNPWFYAFLVAAAVVGAIVVFGIVRSIDTGGDDETPTAVPVQILQVGLISPRTGDRVMAGEEITFAANVASSDPITKVQLLIDDQVFAEGSAAEKPVTPGATTTTPTVSAKLYEAVVKVRFDDRGDHKAAIRVISGTETRDSESINIVVVESPGDPRVEARVIATTSVRSGPGEEFHEVDLLQPGTDILIAARTNDNSWLLLDTDAPGERWIRRNAVQESTSLANLPVRDVTGTPPPTATPTPEVEATPTPSLSEPDFSPTDARFVFADRGRAALRVSIANSGADFSGPLVVEATSSDGLLVSSQLVFDLSLRSDRVATVDFEVAGALPNRADITVSVDPGNAISELREDNNTVTFPGVAAPADPPEIIISDVSIIGSAVTVLVTNLGGQLGDSEITVRLDVAGQQVTESTTASIGTDETLQFTLEAPGTGSGTVQVLIDGATAASQPVDVGLR